MTSGEEKEVEDSDEEGSHTGLTQEIKQIFIEETPRKLGRKRLRGKEKEEEQGTPAKSARISVKNLVDEIEKKEQEARKIKEKEGKKEIKANAKIARGSKLGNKKSKKYFDKYPLGNKITKYFSVKNKANSVIINLETVNLEIVNLENPKNGI